MHLGMLGQAPCIKSQVLHTANNRRCGVNSYRQVRPQHLPGRATTAVGYFHDIPWKVGNISLSDTMARIQLMTKLPDDREI